MLKHLRSVHINPSPFRPQPIRSSMDERAIRFELERRACQSLKKVLQLKLQQKRIKELVSRGTMPPLKTPAVLPEQRQGHERNRTEEYLKRKVRRRPERTELIRMCIFEETSAESLPQAKKLQLKRARLADNLNEKIACRPGPMELIHKNILPVHSSIKKAIRETQFPEALGMNSSCDEESNDSLSPEQPISLDCPLGPGVMNSPTQKLAESEIFSPTQVFPASLSFPPISDSFTSPKQTTTSTTSSACSTGVKSDIKIQTKLNSECFPQKPKKTKDNKPKIKKLKYHQYIPPDQKGDKEPPPHLDSSYAKILQQQQLFLQLQILTQQQQQQLSYHTNRPASFNDQKPSTFSSSNSSSPPSAAGEGATTCGASVSVGGNKVVSANPNLDGMKVAELKCELKLRSLPVSGTKNDLIERLRTYQELNRGSSTYSVTGGGTTELRSRGPERSPKTIKTSNSIKITSEEQQLQPHQASSLSADASSNFCPAGVTPKQLNKYGGNIGSLTPQSSSPAAIGPEEITFNSNSLREQMSSVFPQLTLQPLVAQLPANIKEEPRCSTPAPCHFSLKSPSSQRRCMVSSAGLTSRAAPPPVTIDKDRMLREKDKQIAELTRRLRQKQKLVETLKLQLEQENREATTAQQPGVLGLKEELNEHQLNELDVVKVTIKQEAIETEISECEMHTTGLSQSTIPAQQAQTQTHLQIKPEQESKQKTQEQIYLQQLAHEQAIQKVEPVQSHNQSPGTQHRLFQQRQKKRVQLKHQKLVAPQQQTQIQEKPQQISQAIFTRQSASTPSFSFNLLKRDSTPTLVSDSNGNHFLISLNNRNESNDTSQGKEGRHISLPRFPYASGKVPGSPSVQVAKTERQRNLRVFKQQNIKNGILPKSPLQPHEGNISLTAPPSLQPFTNQGFTTVRKNTSSHSPFPETSPGLDVLLSPLPLSPVSNKAATSPPDEKEKEDFIDIILQAGGLSTTFRPAPDPSLRCLNPDSCASPPPSPLHLLLSLPTLPICASSQPAPSPQPLPQGPDDTKEEKQHLSVSASGRLEDFLESTTGKPLLGVEPGGLLTLIDDLHSQMLCTPSILDHPPSPMDTIDIVGDGGQRLVSTDWSRITTGEEKDEETPTLAPLGPQTPLSVFSTDFLDSSDLHWGSCL